MGRRTRATKDATQAAAEPSAPPPAPIFFYGASNKNGWLSQMYITKFQNKGRTYVCNEQFFQFAKAALFEDAVGIATSTELLFRS